MSLLAVVGVMVFAAGLSYRYIVGAVLLMLPVAGHRPDSGALSRRRLLAFLDPWADPLGDGFQIIQSLIAVGTGGVFGKGLMEGVQKLFYLPEPHTDFIYAVIAEETGLLGALVILACFAVIAWRGMRTVVARARQLRLVSRPRHHDDAGPAGVREHQRGAGHAADQGHSAAARQRRRIVAADQPRSAWACC